MSVTTTYQAGTFGCPGFCSGDAAACKKFYSSLLGWEAADMGGSGGNYTMFKVQGEAVAGMYQMADDRKKAGVKPHWNCYLAVDNIDETVKKTTALGGKVLTQPFDAMGDVMANLQDPTGGKFSVWQQKTQPEPARLNEVGALCWEELYTDDTAKSAAFYSDLFGWRAEPFDGNSPMPYTVFLPEGNERGIGGMLKITDEMQGMKPGWIPYFMVADTGATMAKARTLGAEVHGPIEIPQVGTIAMLKDTEGAPFAVITPAGGEGCGNQ